MGASSISKPRPHEPGPSCGSRRGPLALAISALTSASFLSSSRGFTEDRAKWQQDMCRCGIGAVRPAESPQDARRRRPEAVMRDVNGAEPRRQPFVQRIIVEAEQRDVPRHFEAELAAAPKSAVGHEDRK